MLRIFISLIFILTSQANAMVSFNIQNAPFISNLKVENNLMLIQDSKQDFVILYNKKNEMAYIKHKNIEQTFKFATSKINQPKVLTNITPELTELTLLNFKSRLFTVSSSGGQCMQIYGAEDLNLNSGASSAFNLYKTFVYFTGQLEATHQCKNISISKFFDQKIGFPMAIFYQGKQVKLSAMENADISMAEFLKQKNLNTAKASKPTLKLQYELMFSLLTENQQQTFLKTAENKPLEIKIKAIDNLLQKI